jgi:hypothetical protein
MTIPIERTDLERLSLDVAAAQDHLTEAQGRIRQLLEEPVRTMLLGASVNRSGMNDYDAFVEAQRVVSGRLRMRGTYDSARAPLFDGHPAHEDEELGVESWMLFKTLEHNRIREILRSIPEGRRSRTIASVWHEPEDNIRRGEFTLDEWTLAQEVAADEGAELGVATAAVLMQWTWDPRSGRDPEEYGPGVVVHPIVGIDVYDDSGTRSLSELLGPVLSDVRDGWGVAQWGIRETGTHSDDSLQWWRDAVSFAYAEGAGWFLPWDSPRAKDFHLTDEERVVIADAVDQLLPLR